jgi:hypothetical protein
MFNKLAKKDYVEANLRVDFAEGKNDVFGDLEKQVEFNISVSQMPDWMTDYIKLAMDGVPLSDLRDKHGEKIPTYGMKKEIKKFFHKK